MFWKEFLLRGTWLIDRVSRGLITKAHISLGAVITDREEEYNVCLSDLVSYTRGCNDPRLLRIFIFDVSISLFSSF